PANQVFTITVSNVGDSGADYAISLLQPVKHAVQNEDNVSFTVTATVTDADGSTRATTFAVGIDDDMPAIGGAHSYIANGDFTQGDWPHSADWGVWDDSVQGWDLTPGSPRLERVASGYLGATSSNGAPMVDLDASPGDVGIQQTITGLQPNQAYTLTF